MTNTLRWQTHSVADFPLKRSKVQVACEACRGKKIGCDGEHPCKRCSSKNIQCTYNSKPNKSRLNSTKNSMSVDSPSAVKNNADTPIATSITLESNHLHKITFVNEFYEALRSQQSHTMKRYGTSIPPLLLDFFGMSSQPFKSWESFFESLTKYYDNDSSLNNNPYFMRETSERESNELVREVSKMFVAHNLLYGAFLNCRALTFMNSSSIHSCMQQPQQIYNNSNFNPSSNSIVLSPVSNSPFSPRPSAAYTSNIHHTPTTTNSNSNDALYYSIIMLCVLSITFQSAYQSLPSENCSENAMNSLYLYSHLFYREAHKRFFEMCFPIKSADVAIETNAHSQQQLILLAEASVLLAHYQCIAISGDQAYMTIKLGLDMISRCHAPKDSEEKESFTILTITLEAWYIWLSFYLQRNSSSFNQEYIENVANKKESSYTNKTPEQIWAMNVTDAYSSFLGELLNSKCKSSNQNIRISFLKEKIKKLDEVSFQMHMGSVHGHIIHLFNNILSIQLFSSQIEATRIGPLLSESTSVNTTTSLPVSNSPNSLKQKHQKDDSGSEFSKPDSDIMETCIQASQNILTTVNRFMFNNSSTSDTFTQPLPLSIIYSVCVASQIALFSIKTNHTLMANRELLLQETHSSPSVMLYHQLSTFLKLENMQFEAFEIINNKLSEAIWGRKQDSTADSILVAAAVAAAAGEAPLASSGNMPQFLNGVNVSRGVPNELQLIDLSKPLDPTSPNTTTGATANANVFGQPLHSRSRIGIDEEQLKKLSHGESVNYRQQQEHEQQQQQFYLQQHQLQQQQLQQQQLQQQLHFQHQQQQQENHNYQHHSNADSYNSNRVIDRHQDSSIERHSATDSPTLRKRQRHVAVINEEEQDSVMNDYYYGDSSSGTNLYKKTQQMQQYDNSDPFHYNDRAQPSPPSKRAKQNMLDYGSLLNSSDTMNHINIKNESVADDSHHRSRHNSVTSFIDQHGVPNIADTIIRADQPEARSHTADAASFLYNYLALNDHGSSANTVIDSSTTNMPYYSDHNQSYSDKRDGYQSHIYSHNDGGISLHQYHHDRPASSNEIITSQVNGLDIPKLPLPHPSKLPSSPVRTTWSAYAPSKVDAKTFAASEIQTLHYSQTPPLVNFEQTGFNLVGSHMMHEMNHHHPQSNHPSPITVSSIHNSELLYQQEQIHAIMSAHTSRRNSTEESTVIGINRSSMATEEEVTAAAAAAEQAAVKAAETWAAVKGGASNHVSPTANSDLLSHGMHSAAELAAAAAAATGHWINSEKVSWD